MTTKRAISEEVAVLANKIENLADIIKEMKEGNDKAHTHVLLTLQDIDKRQRNHNTRLVRLELSSGGLWAIAFSVGGVLWWALTNLAIAATDKF